MEVERLLTADEVASLLQVSRLRVYELVRRGRIGGAIRLGRQVRFSPTRLAAWMDAGGHELPGGWREHGAPDTGDRG